MPVPTMIDPVTGLFTAAWLAYLIWRANIGIIY